MCTITIIQPFCSVHTISERHQLLRETISTRQDEEDSYEMVNYLNNCLTPIFLIFLCLELLLFYTYTNMVTTFYIRQNENNKVVLDASLEENNQGQ